MPFTRFVFGVKDFANLQRYLDINKIEGIGFNRAFAESVIARLERERQRFRKLAGMT